MRLIRKLAIDLGTTNSVIWETEKGIVLNEPSMVAVTVEERRVVAVGNEAKEMLGKTPEYLEVVLPMEEGVVSDYAVTEAMLKYFLKMVMGPVWLLGPEVMISVPAGVSQVEQRAVVDAVLAAGARKANLIDKPLAAAIGAKVPVAEASGNMIIDIGGGVTEAAVISLGGVVTAKSIRTGGVKLDMAVNDFLKKKYNLVVGSVTAEMVKIKLGSAIKLKRAETMEVSGRDAISGLPQVVEVSSDDIFEAIRPTIDMILVMVRSALEATPPELVADIMDRGIILSGGGAMLRNIDVLTTREIGVATHVALEPQQCVIRGIGVAMENLEAYQRAIRS